MLTENARFDYSTGQAWPNDTGTWEHTPSTWDLWTSWYTQPELPLVFYAKIQNPDNIWPWHTDFNLKIETSATGTVGYEVYTFDTQGGLLSTTTINAGDYDVPAFSGASFQVAIVVNQTAGLPVINGVTITATNQMVTQYSSGVDTSGLAGTQSARQLPLTRQFSAISNITVDVREVTAYNVDLYVSNWATSQTVIPRVVSKNRSTPTIALVGIDNSARDAVVDLTITGLPQQYMQGNNLYLR